jgi:hypothetical protein
MPMVTECKGTRGGARNTRAVLTIESREALYIVVPCSPPAHALARAQATRQRVQRLEFTLPIAWLCDSATPHCNVAKCKPCDDQIPAKWLTFATAAYTALDGPEKGASQCVDGYL